MKSWKCKTCENLIFTYQLIDGIKRNTSARKRCIKCSPFKQIENKSKPCLKCGKQMYYYEVVNGVRKSVHKRKFCISCVPLEVKLTKHEKILNNKKWVKNYRDKVRRKAIHQLGGKCNVCGSADFNILEFDHIGGGGRKDKNANNRIALYKSICAGREDIQLLCGNCHVTKTRNGKLPISKRLEAIDVLGGRCVRCENENKNVLEFDHVNNNGADDRSKYESYYTYRQALWTSIINNKRNDIRLLCRNCHITITRLQQNTLILV